MAGVAGCGRRAWVFRRTFASGYAGLRGGGLVGAVDVAVGVWGSGRSGVRAAGCFAVAEGCAEAGVAWAQAVGVGSAIASVVAGLLAGAEVSARRQYLCEVGFGVVAVGAARVDAAIPARVGRAYLKRGVISAVRVAVCRVGVAGAVLAVEERG